MSALHYSALRAFAKSPAHYKALSERPRTDSGPMRIGRLVHAMVLGGAYVVFDGTRRGKAWDEFKAANEGQEIYTASEHDDARSIADAVLAHPEAMELLTGERELALEWTVDGRPCAGRLDALSGVVTDLKTTSDASPDRLIRHALKMGYHAQLAWYLDGVAASGRAVPEAAHIVAVETEYPHVITTLRLTPAALDAGRALYRRWLAQLADCERTGNWPGYVEGTIPMDAPLYSQAEDDEEEDAMSGLILPAPGDAAPIDPLSRIQALKVEQSQLLVDLTNERKATIARLVEQCAVLGRLTRRELGDGILARRRGAAPVVPTAPRKPRTKKSSPNADTAATAA